jgi:hypothetical protein
MRRSTTLIAYLATILLGSVVQSSAASRTELAVLQAPVGHRQPTLNDLAPWLREKEGPSVEGPKPTQHPQTGSGDVEQRGQQDDSRRTRTTRPTYGVPNICEPC